MSKQSPAQEYTEHYTEKSLLQKLQRVALTAGRELIEKVLVLYHAARDPRTPAWAKAVIYSNLGYFILPADAIPDLIPGVGYADDLGALTVALGIVALHIKPEHRKLAREKLARWFGAARHQENLRDN